MSDIRPSENQDDRLEFPMAKQMGILPSARQGGYVKPARVPVKGSVEDLLEQADHGEPSQALVYAQIATALAVRDLADEVQGLADALRKAVER